MRTQAQILQTGYWVYSLWHAISSMLVPNHCHCLPHSHPATPAPFILNLLLLQLLSTNHIQPVALPLISCSPSQSLISCLPLLSTLPPHPRHTCFRLSPCFSFSLAHSVLSKNHDAHIPAETNLGCLGDTVHLVHSSGIKILYAHTLVFTLLQHVMEMP